ncbi:MAG TPA: hypothetical protein VFP46_00690 [Candidatus Paceibacterota bacterium]|nr:hypothetical protein [Candidatus Paceibacterota bacterium]
MRRHVLSLVLLLGILPGLASAQSLDLGVSGDAFSISVFPTQLVPGGTATLSFVSTAIDLSSATLRVTANGREVYAGTVHDVDIALPKAGSVTTVTATVTARGAPYTKTLTLQPQDILLIVEPISTAPALYPGKPRVPLAGASRIVAMTSFRTAGGSVIGQSSLAYTWTVDGTRIANSSGIGKSSIIVASPLQYRGRTVSVAVSTQDGKLTGNASLSIAPYEPTVRLYENDPLLGIRFDRALPDAYAVAGAEAGLFAVPFSFASDGHAPFIEWFLDGASAQTGNSITLRPAGSGEGSASLSAVVSKGEARATDNLQIIFGRKSAQNFFGL